MPHFELVQNPILNKTILFGGYNPTLPALYLEQGAMFQFSYYADTFIYDDGLSSGSPPAWKQVITRGFPTYRAQAKLFSDPETGKVYLFGGYTNAQFVPQKKDVVMRSFNDLWQLRLDLPGGFFDGVDLEEEARTAKAGPWQRCFNCGSAGPWRKCGGESSILLFELQSGISYTFFAQGRALAKLSFVIQIVSARVGRNIKRDTVVRRHDIWVV